MRYLNVVNWEKYQHYKDRNPPWIKLHQSLLDNYDFQCLQDASKLHLILIWVLASRHNNRIPFDEPWLSQKMGLQKTLKLQPLIDAGFLVFDSTPLADCEQSAMPEERRGETDSARARAVFVKPTLAEVEAYGREIDFEIDGVAFCAYYETAGWQLKRGPMKNWRAAVWTWKKLAEKRQAQKTKLVEVADDF